MVIYPAVFFVFNMLKYIAIFGNVIYILWILRNGIDEGFSGTIVQVASYSGLIVLLILNSILIYRKK
jgi:hypothetical protein